MKDEKNDDEDRFSGECLKYSGIGFEMVASVGTFCLIGYFVDRLFDISPIGIVCGAILGVIVGLYALIKEAFLGAKSFDSGKGLDDKSLEPKQDENEKEQ